MVRWPSQAQGMVYAIWKKLVCGLVLSFGGGPELIRGRGLFQHTDRNSVIDLKERFKFLL